MNSFSILAVAGSEAEQTSDIIKEQPIGEQQTQTTVPSDANGPAGPATAPKSPFGMLPMIGLMVLVMYFILFRGPRKKQQQHKKMVQSLQKNDKVRTIGGIIGTIVDVKDDEITLKIDEANNTKIKISTSAIGRNLSTETKQ